MKYIRTEDGVYEVHRYYEPRDYYWVKQDCEQPIDSDEIIKQADTIEELCDMWVIAYSIKCHEFGSVVANFMPYNKKKVCLEDKVPVYGAIWTDKGLIYVAKMNESGKLELL